MGCLRLDILEENHPPLKVVHNDLTFNGNGHAGAYLFGFNGMERDDEIYGDGNAYDFGARVYDSRIGKWFSVDPIVKHHLSSYQFGAGNPIIFIDPDGNTEFYFNGKWIGSDGINNNMLGVVKTKDVSKAIKKAVGDGETFFIDTKSNTDAVFSINKDVLGASIDVLEKTLDEGGDREVTTVLEDCGDGTFKAGEFQVGDPTNYEKGEVIKGGSISSDDGSVSIHSHPVGFKANSPNDIQVHNANQLGPNDAKAFKSMDQNIIVGKNVKPEGGNFTVSDGTYTDNRPLSINVYDKNSKPQGSVSYKEAKKIIKTVEKKKP